MKKAEKAPPEPLSEDIEALEDWEEVSSGGTPKEDPPKKGPADERPTEVFKQPKPPVKPAKAPLTQVIDEVVHMSADVPVHLVAVIGRTTVSVKEVMNYQMGQVIDLGRPPGETVDLVAGGKLFARGELVDIDGKLGVRIVKLVR
jgi:flagellar motor switch protein FliM